MSCTNELSEVGTGFTQLNVQTSGVDFVNKLKYSEENNIYTFRSFYNGAGVALADFNNDGLVDIFFSGNQVDNALYLNLGNMRFMDVSKMAGIKSENVWSTGVSIVDINSDGWPDIYVSKSGDLKGERRHNELFINQGVSHFENGVPIIHFSEESRRYGLDDVGLSIHAVFFDFDLDGDLDCYLLNNSLRSVGNYDLRPGQREIRDSLGGNKLLRNNTIGGDTSVAIFEDISEQAGIYGSEIGFGLGVSISDVNKDGWPDIYVSNDFFEKDYLYINQSDGTFKESVDTWIDELSFGAMGADIADIDNDGWPDIFVTEMLPREEDRYKTKSLFENWNKYKSNIETGYHRQFSRNTLQRNQNGQHFIEIGRYAGVEATDWSWGALIFDMDNDGFKDLFVANGIYKDILDQDYIHFYADPEKVRQVLFDKKGGLDKLVDKIPSQAIHNYAFKNLGELRFEEVQAKWGLDEVSFSHGSAYADLDNDGDLDLVVSNVNMASFIYQNRHDGLAHSYLQLSLRDTFSLNQYAVGAKVYVHASCGMQFIENFPARGFMSSVDTRLHFGLGKSDQIDSVKIIWPGGFNEIINDLAINSHHTIYKSSSTYFALPSISDYHEEPSTYFEESKDFKGLFVHEENDYSDFDRESLLLIMNSNLGPAVCTGDINNDGVEDFYVGGGVGQAGALYIQLSNGKFRRQSTPAFEVHSASEDVDCIFFDANGDGLQDIYVVSGSTEFGSNNSALADRLYINQGSGNFNHSPQILPTFNFENTSRVLAIDYDNDGDKDLIVAGFIRPFAYGLPTSTYILSNDGVGNFSNVSDAVAPDLENVGMISDIAVADIDGDGDEDVILVGHWMAPVILINEGGKFRRISYEGESKLHGWWHSVSVTEPNELGHRNIVLGNMGLNVRHRGSAEHPLRLYINDFDANGRIEQIFSYSNDQGEFPFAQRNDLMKQLPYLSKKYPDFASYGGQQIKDIFAEEILAKGQMLMINESRHVILYNRGALSFDFISLPYETQLFPIYVIMSEDIDGDGIEDLWVGGNQSRAKPEWGINAAGRTLLLLGKGKNGDYRPIPSSQTGVNISGDVRSIKKLRHKGKDKYLFGVNNAAIRLFEASQHFNDLKQHSIK